MPAPALRRAARPGRPARRPTRRLGGHATRVFRRYAAGRGHLSLRSGPPQLAASAPRRSSSPRSSVVHVPRPRPSAESPEAQGGLEVVQRGRIGPAPRLSSSRPGQPRRGPCDAAGRRARGAIARTLTDRRPAPPRPPTKRPPRADPRLPYPAPEYRAFIILIRPRRGTTPMRTSTPVRPRVLPRVPRGPHQDRACPLSCRPRRAAPTGRARWPVLAAPAACGGPRCPLESAPGQHSRAAGAAAPAPLSRSVPGVPSREYVHGGGAAVPTPCSPPLLQVAREGRLFRDMPRRHPIALGLGVHRRSRISPRSARAARSWIRLAVHLNNHVRRAFCAARLRLVEDRAAGPSTRRR